MPCKGSCSKLLSLHKSSVTSLSGTKVKTMSLQENDLQSSIKC